MDHFSCLYFIVRNIKQSHDLEHNYGQSNVNIWTSSVVIVCHKYPLQYIGLVGMLYSWSGLYVTHRFI